MMLDFGHVITIVIAAVSGIVSICVFAFKLGRQSTRIDHLETAFKELRAGQDDFVLDEAVSPRLATQDRRLDRLEAAYDRGHSLPPGSTT